MFQVIEVRVVTEWTVEQDMRMVINWVANGTRHRRRPSVVFRRPMEHSSTFHVVSQHVPVPRRAATAPFEGYFERTCETGDWRDGGERTSEALHNIRLGVDIYVVNEEKRSTRRANGSV